MDNTLHLSRPGRRRLTRDAALMAVAFSVGTVTLAPAAGRIAGSTDQLPALREAPLKQYRAFRRMHAVNDKFNQEAWIDAWTEMDGAAFKYEITSERGSDYIRNRVLKAILTREQDLVTRGESARAEISAENYLFEEPDAQDSEFRYVLLKPKRKDILLVNGRMVLNPAGTELLRVEGTLAKNPSFWTSTVNIVRDYAMLDGVRVPVSTATVAKLKLAGHAQMDVRYEYETVNGRPVDLASIHRAGGPSGN
jgi:hypothetical protein